MADRHKYQVAMWTWLTTGEMAKFDDDEPARTSSTTHRRAAPSKITNAQIEALRKSREAIMQRQAERAK